MYYYQKDNGKNIYVYDSVNEKFLFMGHKAWKEFMEDMVLSNEYATEDGTIKKIDENQGQFFMEYIPRVMQFEENIKTTEKFEEIK